MDLSFRELEYAVSALGSTAPALHHIGVLISAAGRFLHCSNCGLRFELVAGVQQGKFSEQFASHPCTPLLRSAKEQPACCESEFTSVRD